MSGSGISWAISKSAPCYRQTTTPAPHHSLFYRPDALPTAQTTASKHWKRENEKQWNHARKWTIVLNVSVNVSQQQIQHLHCYKDLSSSCMLLWTYMIFPSPKSTTAMPWNRTLEMTTLYSLNANSEYTANKQKWQTVSCLIHYKPVLYCTLTASHQTYNNNNDRLTAFDPGQPG